MENPLKVDDLGLPLFQETFMCTKLGAWFGASQGRWESATSSCPRIVSLGKTGTELNPSVGLVVYHTWLACRRTWCFSNNESMAQGTILKFDPILTVPTCSRFFSFRFHPFLFFLCDAAGCRGGRGAEKVFRKEKRGCTIMCGIFMALALWTKAAATKKTWSFSMGAMELAKIVFRAFCQ